MSLAARSLAAEPAAPTAEPRPPESPSPTDREDPLARAERYRPPTGVWSYLKSLPKRIFQTVFRSAPYPTRSSPPP